MLKQRAALIALLGGSAIFAVKISAWMMSGSVALLSDALESIVNILASIMVFYAVHLSDTPADKAHQYGHQKIENISSFVEGFLIVIAAIFVIHSAIERIYQPFVLTHLESAIAVSIFATGTNFFLSWFLSRAAFESGSTALEGDAKHLLSDVITSFGVAGGLFVSRFTGWAFIDPALAILVSTLILRMGVVLILKSAKGLMDYSSPEEERKIKEVLQRHGPRYVDFHNVKTRRSGNRIFAELHLSVDGSLSVKEAHDFTEHLEKDLREELPNVTLTIHVEPPRTKSK